MERPFTSKEAIKLFNEHHELKKKLINADTYLNYYKESILKASEALITQEVLNVLKDIPIEEINRGKNSFRIKTLHDYGYNNISDIYVASVYEIVSVHGISESTAHSIKRIVNDLVLKVHEGMKVKISIDNKNSKSTELVLSIYRYKCSKPYSKTCKQIIYSKRKKIDYAMEDLSKAKSSLKWFFASKMTKQKAVDAYKLLSVLLESNYKEEVNLALDSLNTIKCYTSDAAWQSFLENSIIFFNILEDVNPGILGTDDSVYGLPEELARQIQEEFFFPKGLLCELRCYQEWGVKFALHQERVLLGDEMGLGKTVQAIATMVSLINTGATHFIVVCPTSVLTNWCREIRKMSLLKVTKIHGSDRNFALKSWLNTGGVAVTTYGTIGHIKLDSNFNLNLLVVDEAHYIKNPKAQRTINVKNISRHSKRVLFMTGTALENKVDEMIELIQMLQPRIANEVRTIAFMSSASQFRDKVAPVYYRRKREDVLTELPDLIEKKDWCTMMPEEESGRKVIVFSFFLDTIRKIADLLGNKCLKPINGSVTPEKRQEIIDIFDKSSAGTVLVAQIQSGGTGLNIQSASVVIICEPQFKPSIENQAISRAYRMGQIRNVLVYRLLCENTVDEKITLLLEKKQIIFDMFADKSVAANESMELDNKKFGDLINEEIERINAKYV